MNAIFLNKSEARIRDVFNPENTDALHALVDLDDNVYSLPDVEAEPEKFKDVRFIFSTWGMERPDEEQIRRLFPSLEAVFYAAGSVQAFAAPFLHCGVKVCSAWAANAVPVAEFTFAQIILANKGYFRATRITPGGGHKKADDFCKNYAGNYDAIIGIIGAGMIGKMVIRKLKTLEHITVLVFDPFLPEAVAEELGVEKVSLEELFERSHVVSNHLANNEQTKGMLQERHFASMKPFATFINTGRAAQLEQDGFFRVLQARPDLTALCDVTSPEPPEEGSPYYTYENIFLTPHIAGSEAHERRRMSKYMVEELERHLKGEQNLYEVSLKMLETMA